MEFRSFPIPLFGLPIEGAVNPFIAIPTALPIRIEVDVELVSKPVYRVLSSRPGLTYVESFLEALAKHLKIKHGVRVWLEIDAVGVDLGLPLYVATTCEVVAKLGGYSKLSELVEILDALLFIDSSLGVDPSLSGALRYCYVLQKPVAYRFREDCVELEPAMKIVRLVKLRNCLPKPRVPRLFSDTNLYAYSIKALGYAVLRIAQRMKWGEPLGDALRDYLLVEEMIAGLPRGSCRAEDSRITKLLPDIHSIDLYGVELDAGSAKGRGVGDNRQV